MNTIHGNILESDSKHNLQISVQHSLAALHMPCLILKLSTKEGIIVFIS